MSFIGPHHAFHHKKQIHKKDTSFITTLVDKGAYIIGFMAVAANIPQLWNVWVEQQTDGVSLISWIGFLIGSIFWFWYGKLHKEKAIMIINGFLIIIQLGIVIGLLLIPT